MRIFWPPAEAAQADYERLRAAALAGTALTDVTELRFARGGLSALIARPVSPPNLVATVHGALRRPWSAQADPRLDALAAGFLLLFRAADPHPVSQKQGEAQ